MRSNPNFTSPMAMLSIVHNTQDVLDSLQVKLGITAMSSFSLVVEHVKSLKRNKLTLLNFILSIRLMLLLLACLGCWRRSRRC